MAPITTTSASSSTGGYTFRETTERKHAETAALGHKKIIHRIVLTPSKSASYTHEVSHDCDVLNTDHAVNKAAARLFHSLFRFSFAGAFNCATRRGPTHFNGSQCKCGNCEAAHAALSPTLFDDILDKITAQLEATSFNQLKPAEQEYLQARFSLSDYDQKKLSSEDKATRMKQFHQIIGRLTPAERQGTFVNTPTEFARNATYDNHRSSNRLDCHLEHHLRRIEDDLAEECRLETKTPIEALTTLQDKYRDLVETAITNLKNDLEQIKHLHDAWNELIDCQKTLLSTSEETADYAEEFKLYLELVDIYLKAYEIRFTKLQGTPSLKSLKEYLRSHQSPHTLKTIRKLAEQPKEAQERFQLNIHSLKIPTDSDAQFEKAKREIERRLQEAENQLRVLCQTPDDMKGMLKHLFSEKSVLGLAQTPQKANVASAITRLMPALTPMRTDLQRKKPVALPGTSDDEVSITMDPLGALVLEDDDLEG